jgi:uncharacterized protein (TIGR03437 family)
MPAQVATIAPAFFLLGNTGYAVATHPNGTAVGATTPARSGETIAFYGTGFGTTTPPVADGVLVTSALPLAVLPSVTVGGLTAQVTFAGISATGLYQLNVVVPDQPTGDVPVVAQVAGVSTPVAVLPIVNQPD